MTIVDVLDHITEFSDEDVIFAKRPFSTDSEVLVGRLDSDFCPPKSVVDDGFCYLLEVELAKEILEVFGTRPSTSNERCDLIIYYAEQDAFPDWVYDRS